MRYRLLRFVLPARSGAGACSGDQNSDKSGQDDKRCMMEARLEGRQPTAVTHQAASLADAVDGAADKLKRSLESTLARLKDVRRT